MQIKINEDITYELNTLYYIKPHTIKHYEHTFSLNIRLTIPLIHQPCSRVLPVLSGAGFA